MRKRLLIQQPRLLGYRKEEFRRLKSGFDLTISFSPGPAHEGFGMTESSYLDGVDYVRTPEVVLLGGRMTYQRGLVSAVRRLRPDVVFIQANVRYICFWMTALYCRLTGVRVVGHGQGLYRYPSPALWRRVLYWCNAAVVDSYVCYGDLSKQSMVDAGVPSHWLSVAQNSLINTAEKGASLKSGVERGVLFIGRLRQRSGVLCLIEAVARARAASGQDLELHVIGDGVEKHQIEILARENPWVKLYGAVYDDETIAEIGKRCFAGVYPGDAGLSVVHMMSLSLPPIVHGDIAEHMGPEPACIAHGYNGFFFSRSSPTESICDLLVLLRSDPALLKRCQENAHSTYRKLTSPSFGERLANVLKAVVTT